MSTITAAPAAALPVPGSFAPNASGIFVPTAGPAPALVVPSASKLVTAKEMSTGEQLAQLEQLHASIAAREGAELANFQLGGAIDLATQVDRDTRRAALIATLQAGVPADLAAT